MVAVMTAIDDSDGDLIDASMPREGAGLDVFVAELENIVEHKGIGIGKLRRPGGRAVPRRH